MRAYRLKSIIDHGADHLPTSIESDWNTAIDAASAAQMIAHSHGLAFDPEPMLLCMRLRQRFTWASNTRRITFVCEYVGA